MTKAEAKKQELKKAAIIFAYVALFVVSIAAMTTYFSTDLIRPLVTEFKENLGWTTAQVTFLSSIYSFPPIIFLFFSGVITDKFGIKKSSLILMALITVGSLFVTFMDFKWILIGRLLIGLGAESFFVVMNKIVTKWFRDKQLAMAFGLNLLLCRLGSIAAFYILPWVVRDYSLKTALWVGAGLTVSGFLLIILYCIIDKYGDDKGYVAAVAEAEDEEPFKMSDAFHLPKSFWAITLLCVTYYSTIFPFTGVASDFFVEKEKKILLSKLEQKGVPPSLGEKLFKIVPDETALSGLEQTKDTITQLKETKLIDNISLLEDSSHTLYALKLDYLNNGTQTTHTINYSFLKSPAADKLPKDLKEKLRTLIPDETIGQNKSKMETIASDLQNTKLCSSATVTIDEEKTFYPIQLTYTHNNEPQQLTIDWPFLTESDVYKKLNDTKIYAGRLTSLILIISMCVTWLFGLLIDKIGKRATLMIIGSILMIPCHVVMAYTDIPLWIPMTVLGLSFALVPAALWPAVPLIVKDKMLGTAYGIIFMIQNIGLFLFEPAAGKLFDMTGNYKLSMIMFSTLGLVGLFFAIWLKILEKKGGGYLDTSKAKIL